MSGFTPGPWRVVGECDDNIDEIAAPCYEHPNCGKTIAFGPGRFNRPLLCSSGPNTVANARLIAAAPDLLAACKTALDIAEEWVRSELCGTSSYTGEMARLDQVRATIARAEGHQ